MAYVEPKSRMCGNNEIFGIWKETVVDYFKTLSGHLSGGTDEKHENLKVIGVREGSTMLKCFVSGC